MVFLEVPTIVQLYELVRALFPNHEIRALPIYTAIPTRNKLTAIRFLRFKGSLLILKSLSEINAVMLTG